MYQMILDLVVVYAIYVVPGIIILSFLLAWRKSVRLMKCEKILLEVIPKKDREYWSHTRHLYQKVTTRYPTKMREVAVALIRLSNRGYVVKGPRDDTWSWTG